MLVSTTSPDRSSDGAADGLGALVEVGRGFRPLVGQKTLCALGHISPVIPVRLNVVQHHPQHPIFGFERGRARD
jgi:hypothetical protein